MLVLPPTIGRLPQTNLITTARSGTTITADAVIHTKGAWTSIIDPTSKPTYGIALSAVDVSGIGAVTSLLLDIGYGPTGGGNEEVVIPDLDCGAAALSIASQGKMHYFPVYIPSGVRVSGRCQAFISADTVIVSVWLFQDPPYPSVGGGVVAYGVDAANSCGTSVTPANNAFGLWTQIGATTDPVRAHRMWTVEYDLLADISCAGADLIVEIGTGPDASNVTAFGTFQFTQTTSENITGPMPHLVYADVPAGAELWARIASGETEARGIVIYGID